MPDRDDSQDRLPIPQDKMNIIQKTCQETDDEMRWLIALISYVTCATNRKIE